MPLTKMRPMGITQEDFDYLESLDPTPEPQLPRDRIDDLDRDWRPRPEWHGTVVYFVACLAFAVMVIGCYALGRLLAGGVWP